MDVTIAIAVYGAVLSTVVLVLHVRDRWPWLRVVASDRDPMTGDEMMAVEVIHRGGRSVRLWRCGLVLPDNQEHQIFPGYGASRPALPAEVLPHHRLVVVIDQATLGRELRQRGCRGTVKVVAFVEDETHRVHRGRPYSVDVDAWAAREPPGLLY